MSTHTLSLAALDADRDHWVALYDAAADNQTAAFALLDGSGPLALTIEGWAVIAELTSATAVLVIARHGVHIVRQTMSVARFATWSPTADLLRARVLDVIRARRPVIRRRMAILSAVRRVPAAIVAFFHSIGATPTTAPRSE